MKKQGWLAILILCIVSVFFAVPAFAAVQLGTCGSSCTLNVPRYKIVMDLSDPDTFYAIFGGNDGYAKTTNRGQSFDIRLDVEQGTSLGDHSSISMDELGNIYIVDRENFDSFFFRKINAPGDSASDMEAVQIMPAYIPGSDYQTPNILAQNSTHIWIFERKGDEPAANVRYRMSTNGGTTFPDDAQHRGWVSQTNTGTVRIGSLLIEGQPAVIIWYAKEGFRYFVWDGTQFIAKTDSTIKWDADFGAAGQQRAFAMNYLNGVMHVVYAEADKLKHRYKNYNDGLTTWNEITVEDYADGETDDAMLFSPQLTVHGNDMYMFYLYKQGVENNDVVYRKWNSSSEEWGPRITLVSDGQYNRWPNLPAIVNPSADYIPYMWTRYFTSASRPVFIDTLSIAAVCDNDNTCDAGEDCSNCPNDCLDSGEVCCGTTAYSGDCCGDGDCSGLETCVSHVCTAPGPCADGTCDAGDNCPAYDSLCPDNSCYEPACSNGCQQTAVAFGQKDEACTGNNYCSGTGSCTACRTDLESNCNGKIDDTELMNNINYWYSDTLSMSLLMESLSYWKRGYI